jgi:hypothetical protein
MAVERGYEEESFRSSGVHEEILQRKAENGASRSARGGRRGIYMEVR